MWEVAFLTGAGLLTLSSTPILSVTQKAFQHAPNSGIDFYSAISRGQLFPFAFSTIGTLLWLYSREYDKKSIPLKSAVILIIWATSFFAACIYAIGVGSGEFPVWAVFFSICLVVTYSMLRYYLIVVRDMPVDDVLAGMQRKENSMIERAIKRRGGQ